MNGTQDYQKSESVQNANQPIGIEKRCSECKKIKPTTEFHKNKAKKDGLCTECKPCHCELVRQYSTKNKDKIRTRHKKYVKKNRAHIRKKHKQWRDNNKDKVLGYSTNRKVVKSEYDKKRWHKLSPEEKAKEMKENGLNRDKRTENNPEVTIYRTAKKRAQKKNMEFNIKIEDIHIPELCPVLGIKLNKFIYKRGTNRQLKECRPSIDRINNNIGYIQGNIIIISLRANRIKSDATLQEITAIAKWMNEVHNIEENDCGS